MAIPHEEQLRLDGEELRDDLDDQGRYVGDDWRKNGFPCPKRIKDLQRRLYRPRVAVDPAEDFGVAGIRTWMTAITRR
jgi:hypothetical protein